MCGCEVAILLLLSVLQERELFILTESNIGSKLLALPRLACVLTLGRQFESVILQDIVYFFPYYLSSCKEICISICHNHLVSKSVLSMLVFAMWIHVKYMILVEYLCTNTTIEFWWKQPSLFSPCSCGNIPYQNLHFAIFLMSSNADLKISSSQRIATHCCCLDGDDMYQY